MCFKDISIQDYLVFQFWYKGNFGHLDISLPQASKILNKANE